MARHYIRYTQRSIHPDDPGFSDLVDAEKELQVRVAESLKEARVRWKRAAKICLRPAAAYAIHAMNDRQSPLWTEIWIQTIE